jgi:hypothetical protein
MVQLSRRCILIGKVRPVGCSNLHLHVLSCPKLFVFSHHSLFQNSHLLVTHELIYFIPLCIISAEQYRRYITYQSTHGTGSELLYNWRLTVNQFTSVMAGVITRTVNIYRIVCVYFTLVLVYSQFYATLGHTFSGSLSTASYI